MSSQYTFLLSAPSASAMLWWSPNGQPARGELLANATGTYGTDWPRWPQTSHDSRISRTVSLESGQGYHLELLCARPSASATCALGVRVHTTGRGGRYLPRYDPDPHAPQHPHVQHARLAIKYEQRGAYREVQTVSLPHELVAGRDAAHMVIRLATAGVGASAPVAFNASAEQRA